MKEGPKLWTKMVGRKEKKRDGKQIRKREIIMKDAGKMSLIVYTSILL
jgi:hypothetical protein